MNAKEIQELIDFIAQSGLDEVKIKTSDFEISIKKHATPSVAATPPPVATVGTAAPPPAPAPTASPAPAEAAPAKAYAEVRSPMIGTFYRSPDPDSPSFVNVGDEIKKGQPVCIIEAMKLFNEIESEISGRIVKVLVENATPVEYDQPLFLVDVA